MTGREAEEGGASGLVRSQIGKWLLQGHAYLGQNGCCLKSQVTNLQVAGNYFLSFLPQLLHIPVG